MAVVLDTEVIPPRERADAVMAVFEANEVPQHVRFADGDGEVRHRVDLTQYGPSVHFMRNVGSGLYIDRTERHVRQHAPTQVALFVSRGGHGTIARGDRCVSYRHDVLMAMDTMQPYSLRQSARADHLLLIVNDLPAVLAPELVSAACSSISASPLYRLVSAHFRALAEVTADLEPAACTALGRATTELVHATLLTAVDNPHQNETLQDTLFLRMSNYADRHLHDPELTPAQIAVEHFVSLRQLYKLWDRATGQSPHRWIMTRRLARAGDLLAKHAPSVLPVSWVARQCGFTNISHFSRRFREAYGMSPSDWAAAHQGQS